MLNKSFIRTWYLIALIVFSSSSWAGIYEDFFGAVDRDDVATVSRLLARGFDVNSPGPSGQRPLHLAVQQESTRLLDVLLAAPQLRVDAPNAAGETALMLAALKGSLDMCQKLLQKGAQVRREGWNPLHYAASGPSTAAVVFLLELGAPIDAPSPNGSTALMMASRYGVEGSAELLLARGADAALRNQRGFNAADFARMAERQALAARLESGKP